MRTTWAFTLILLLSIGVLYAGCDSGGGGDDDPADTTAVDSAGVDTQAAGDTGDEDTAQAEDTDPSGTDTGGGGDCWQPPPYPQDLYAKEGSSVKATAIVGDDEYIVNFDCAGDEISYRLKNDNKKYAITCKEDDWVLTLSFPTEKGSWEFNANYDEFSIGFTGNSPDFHAWALSDTGALGGSLEATAYDDCSKDAIGSFEATFSAIEPLNKQAAEITGTFDLKL